MGEAEWTRITAQAHEITVFAQVLNFRGIPLDRDPLPVESLSWTVDATARPNLSATLIVPFTEEWAPTTSSSALTPFGNQVEVWLEARGGGEFDKLRLGFGLIKEVVVSRPNNSIAVHLVDLMDAIMASHTKQALPKKDDQDHTDWWWFQDQVDAANVQAWERDADGDVIEPHREGIRVSDPGKRISRTRVISKEERWSAGTSRMTILDWIAENEWRPSYLFLDRNNTRLVRAPA